MEGEHEQLRYSLYKNYTLILVISLLVFCLALIGINHLFKMQDR